MQNSGPTFAVCTQEFSIEIYISYGPIDLVLISINRKDHQSESV
jgi:hypothetical protein